MTRKKHFYKQIFGFFISGILINYCFLVLIILCQILIVDTSFSFSAQISKEGIKLSNNAIEKYFNVKYWHKNKIDYLANENVHYKIIEFEKNDFLLNIYETSSKKTVIFSSIPMKVVPGKEFGLKIKAKFSSGNHPVSVVIFNKEFKKQKSYLVGTEFEEIIFRESIPENSSQYCKISLEYEGGKYQFFIKEFNLYQEVTINSGSNKVFGVFDKEVPVYERGEKVRISIEGINFEKDVTIRWELLGIDQNLVQEGKLTLDQIRPIGNVLLNTQDLGWYSFNIYSDNHKKVDDVLYFSVVPPVGTREDKARRGSYFGTHSEINEISLNVARLMGFSWIRLNSPLITKWNAVQEVKGDFVFNDKAIELIKKKGFEIIGTLDRTPVWASQCSDHPKTGFSNYYGAYACLPNNWEAWKEYVRSVVGRYKNQISHWQIWNEPDIPFLDPPDGMSNSHAYEMIFDNTYPIIKEINPGAKVLGGVAHLYKEIKGPGREIDFLENVLEKELFKKIDVFTFHYYFSGKSFADEIDFRNFNKLKTRLSKGQEIWSTEIGFDCVSSDRLDYRKNHKCTNEKIAGQQFVKYFFMNSILGVQKFFFYNGFFESTRLSDFNYHYDVLWELQEPLPIVSDISILTWFVDWSTSIDEILEGNLKIYRLRRGEEDLYCVWSPGEFSEKLQVPFGSVVLNSDGSRYFYDGFVDIDSNVKYIVPKNVYFAMKGYNGSEN